MRDSFEELVLLGVGAARAKGEAVGSSAAAYCGILVFWRSGDRGIELPAAIRAAYTIGTRNEAGPASGADDESGFAEVRACNRGRKVASSGESV